MFSCHTSVTLGWKYWDSRTQKMYSMEMMGFKQLSKHKVPVFEHRIFMLGLDKLRRNWLPSCRKSLVKWYDRNPKTDTWIKTVKFPVAAQGIFCWFLSSFSFHGLYDSDGRLKKTQCNYDHWRHRIWVRRQNLRFKILGFVLPRQTQVVLLWCGNPTTMNAIPDSSRHSWAQM